MIVGHSGTRSLWKNKFIDHRLTLLIFLGTLALAYGAGGYLEKPSTLLKQGFLHVLFLLNLILSTHHMLMQMKGLSLLANRSLSKICLKNSAVDCISRWEKSLYWGLVISFIFLIYFYYPLSYMGGALEDPLRIEIEKLISLDIVRLFFLGLNFLFVIGIIFINASKAWNLNKFLFSLRLFLYPLAAISPIALYGVFATHGIEYLFVFNKFVSNPQSEKGSLIKISLFIMALLTLSLLPRYIWETGSKTHFLLVLFSAFGVALNYLHYYLDRKIFSFKDKIVREKIGDVF